MSDTPLRLAIDFDNTIHDVNNVPKGHKLGQPIPGARVVLNKLKKDGAIIVIHTVWGDTDQKREAISKWCRYFGIPYDFITNQKPVADYYIDNNGYRFENWKDTLEFLTKR